MHIDLTSGFELLGGSEQRCCSGGCACRVARVRRMSKAVNTAAVRQVEVKLGFTDSG